VQLFGAYHIGQPFFVCEYAGRGQLDQYLREKPKDLWEKLFEAALGGVVHGNLKCNNIGSDGRAKLTDFRLRTLDVSLTDSGREPESELDNRSGAASVGAIRWKAPEVLRGVSSTYASDVCSFVLEATSGKYPWGATLDAVIKFCVVKQHKLPAMR
jgi:serine/threonine protein kinase